MTTKKPYYEHAGITIYHGDCLDVMKDIPDGRVDLTVTSPPYDNLRTYNGNNALWGEHVWKAVIQDLYRVTKDGGVVVWVVGDATIKGSETGTSFKQALWAKECGFNLHDTMIYKKTGCPFPETTRYYPNYEYMFVWSKGKPKTTNLLDDRKNICAGAKKNRPNGTGDRQKDGSIKPMSCDRLGIDRKIKQYGVRFNVWEMSHTGKDRSLHPATFPYKLVHDHIISWSNEGDTVLDPFVGSGTTLVAAKKLHRKSIGIELEEKYCEIAARRLQQDMLSFGGL
jgi:site-specific DNA-methyltransferase (adenine-specific)